MNSDKSPSRHSYPMKRTLALSALALVPIAIVVILGNRPKPETPKSISLSDLAGQISKGQVVRIEDTAESGQLHIILSSGEVMDGVRDPNASLLQQLNQLGVSEEQLAGLEYEVVKEKGSISNPLGMFVFFGFLTIAGYIAYQQTGKADRWTKKRYSESLAPTVKFHDVAGIEDELQELRDLVTFFKNKDRFAALGAKMPRGVLMIGDPGTGKTLIAKAVAGEAGVPFFATSGSEFTEIYVGVGASRIRALFQKARKQAPCIVFIDEIDAVGRARHQSESGAEMEQDQTLNQLLVEMDGFDSSDGVIILAATNRVDILDPALTRPGRFDRRVYINRPDIKGREQILKIHSRGKKLSSSVKLERIARSTPGLVGADLANIINEAAINAVRYNRTEVEMVDFEEAVEKHIAGGVQRKNQVLSTEIRRMIAYHEAGHAVVMHATPFSDPVYKVSIIPRGPTGGYTLSIPEEDTLLVSRSRILARITSLMGGRAAEETFCHDITSGASNDLIVATQLAEEMVMRLGMDNRHGLRVIPQTSSPLHNHQPGSQKTFETIDSAVNSILEDCFQQALQILVANREAVEMITTELLEEETIDRPRFLELMGLNSNSQPAKS